MGQTLWSRVLMYFFFFFSPLVCRADLRLKNQLPLDSPSNENLKDLFYIHRKKGKAKYPKVN